MKLGSLKFGGVIYAVKTKSNLIDPDFGACWGLCDHDTETIWLYEGMSKGRFLDTLFHEMVHACQVVLAKGQSIQDMRLYEKEDIADAIGVGFSQNYEEFARLWRAYKAL